VSTRKSFVYVVRRDGASAPSPRLLVLESHDEPGLEVPKGSVEAGESFEEAAIREVREEAGIEGIGLVCELGTARYEDEEQRFLLAEAPNGMPESFEHTVTGDGEDSGFRYVFHWEPVDARLRAKLVQGCGALVDCLVEALRGK